MVRWFRLFGWAIFFLPLLFLNDSYGLDDLKTQDRVQDQGSPLNLNSPFPSGEGSSGFVLPAKRSYPQDLTLLHSDERGVTFRYSPPKLTHQIKELEEGRFTDLFLPGTTYPSSEAGSPVIPYRLVHFGIPLEGEVRVEVQDLRSSSLSLDFPIIPCPYPDGSYRLKEEFYSREGTYPGKWVLDPQTGFLRDQRVLSLRIYPIQYSPKRNTLQVLEQIEIRIDFSKSTKHEARNVGASPLSQGSKSALTDPFERVYQRVLLNYEEAKGWRKSRKQEAGSRKQILTSKPWVKITTREEGIYRITYHDLQSLGVPTHYIDPRTFQLFNGGSDTLPQSLSIPRPDSQEISLYIPGEEDGRFESGDEIYFFGIPLTGWRMEDDTLYFHRNPYTDFNVYWLTWEGGTGLRMDTLDGSLSDPNPVHPEWYEEKVRFEEEVENPQRSGLSWIWKILLRPQYQSSISFSFPFTLSDLAFPDGELRLILYGKSKTQHNVRVRLNGEEVANLNWNGCDCSSGGKNYPRILTVPVSQFQEGSNSILMEEYQTVPVESEVYFDYGEAEVKRRFVAKGDYLNFSSPDSIFGRIEFSLSGFSQTPLLLDITDPFHPRRVVHFPFDAGNAQFQDDLSSRRRYCSASVFRKPIRMAMDSPNDLKSGGADYIALCHDDFYDAVLPLVEWRRGHLAGIPNPFVERIKVSDVYDNFSWGVTDPTAIRDFLKYTNDTLSPWYPNPSYSLFVGAGSYDYKNNLGNSPPKNFLPPRQEGGMIVTDSRFPQDLNLAFDEWFVIFPTDTSKPQLHLGRVTVRTLQETRTVVEKIIDYEREKAFGPWRNRILLAADDAYSTDDYANDNEYGFTVQCENVLKDYTEPEMDAVKVYMVYYFDWVQGPLKEMPKARQAFIQGIDEGFLAGLYLGHGNIEVLAHEKLFRREPDIDVLKNGEKTFFMYYGSCSVGQFDRPEEEDMASSLQKRKDGGGVATFAASRSTFYSGNGSLASELFDNLFDSPLETIGEVITTTRLNRPGETQRYNLFGDPATEWSPPELDVTLSLSEDKGRQRRSSSSLIGLSQVTVQGTVQDPSFNGFASLTVFDSALPESDTFREGAAVVDYILPGNSIYRGVTPVTNGRFSQSFWVPDPSGMQTGFLGRISAYVWDGIRDGHGAIGDLFVGGRDTLVDDLPPRITLLHGGRVLTPQDTLTLPLNPRITLILEDESGIYLGKNRQDKRLRLVIDRKEDPDDITYLNHLFQYDEGSHTKGVVQVDLSFKDPLRDTTHILEFKASDNKLNPITPQEGTVVIRVVQSQKLALFRVMNYPNPIRDHRTQFVFELTEENVEVEIKVFTVTGRTIKTFRIPGRVGLNAVSWDCRDEKGDAIANGVYLYKVSARTMSQGFSSPTEKVSEVVEKLVIAH